MSCESPSSATSFSTSARSVADQHQEALGKLAVDKVESVDQVEDAFDRDQAAQRPRMPAFDVWVCTMSKRYSRMMEER